MINQPRNTRSNQLELRWSNVFARRWNNLFGRSQAKIDSECLRYLDAYVPRKIGNLIKSGIRETVLGSGRIQYKKVYAKRLYYNPQFNFRGAPQRGAYWFERMKRKYKKIILRRAGELF